MMRDLKNLFMALARSSFRQKFHLIAKDLDYLHSKGIDIIMDHANDFIRTRLAPAHPKNDGKQTPFRGHPIFVAQHATACCCRGCLAKWHQIPQNRPLTEPEIAYVLTVLKHWLKLELKK